MLASFYGPLLVLHSVWRWGVLFAAVAAIAISAVGAFSQRPFNPLGRISSLLYTIAMDLQFLLGAALYFASPIVKSAWANPPAGMQNPMLRFFSMEHAFAMVAALILVHIGSARSKRMESDQKKYAQTLFWYSISLVVILIGIPWWRPLIR